MSKEIETKEKQEMYPGSTVSQTTMEKVPLSAHGTNGTTNGMPFPNQVFKIIQHIHPTTFPPQDQIFQLCQVEFVSKVLKIIDEIKNLTPKKMEKLITMVKDSSITIVQSWEIKDFLLAALNLTMEQWEYFLQKIELEEEDEPGPGDSTQYKLAGILSAARSMNKEGFEKFKKLIMSSPSFRTQEEKLNFVEILTKARSMAEKDFTVLVGMVKDSSITLTIDKVEELVNTYTLLRQLTIEQVDEVFKMVNDPSIN